LRGMVTADTALALATARQSAAAAGTAGAMLPLQESEQAGNLQ
jgi:hypothetical protein